MSTIAFRANDKLKRQLEQLARLKGINMSSLIKLYLTKDIKRELSRITENGMTVADELELLTRMEEGDDGKEYDNVGDLIKDLEGDD